MVSNVGMTYEFGKDFKRNGHHPITILSWHLSGGPEENREYTMAHAQSQAGQVLEFFNKNT
jgi:hypothetical protein